MNLLWLTGACLAFAAGFAIDRGGICAVAAVRQVMEAGRWRLFLSFLECAAWALLALSVANAIGVMAKAGWPAQMSLLASMAGGALFGIGALVNGACAFGSAGRLAAGEASFLALPPGFLIGVWLTRGAGIGAYADSSGLSGIAPLPVVAALALFALWRVWSAWRNSPNPLRAAARLADDVWPPALAMAAIAMANVGLLLIVASWPYTALLTDIALGHGMQVFERVMLALTLLAGAFVGAATAGRFKLRAGTLRDVAARFGGGVFMGLGAPLIPGGNDSLVLIGLPMLQPSALAAYAAMVAAIALGFGARRLWPRRHD